MEQEFPEFLQNMRVKHETILRVSLSRKVQESKGNQRNGKIDLTSAHKVFIRKKNFDTLYKKIDKLFNEQIESVKQTLDHGTRNEALAIEKYQFIMNYKLNRPVKIGKARIIIQSQLFWLGPSPDGVIFDKINQEMGLLEINVLTTRDISLLKVLLLTKHFILLLTKKKKTYLKKEHRFGYYTQIHVAMGLAGLKWCHFVVYVYSGTIIVKIGFDNRGLQICFS